MLTGDPGNVSILNGKQQLAILFQTIGARFYPALRLAMSGRLEISVLPIPSMQC